MQAAPSNIKESQRSQPKVFDFYSMVSIVLNITTRLLFPMSKNPSAVSLHYMHIRVNNLRDFSFP